MGVKDATFRNITCENLILKDGYKLRGVFGLSRGRDAMLQIYGDDGISTVAYLGRHIDNNEMMFILNPTDKREVSLRIDENGGRLNCNNKMGENVVRIAVGDDGGGVVDTRDKFGYRK